MHSAQIAEWILSLVTTPERAAATVGDLMENASSQGRFWFGVLRTAVSLLWREFADDSVHTMGLAFRGLLVQISVGIGMVLLFAVVSGFLAGLLSPIVESSWHPTNAADGPHPWVHAIGMRSE